MNPANLARAVCSSSGVRVSHLSGKNGVAMARLSTRKNTFFDLSFKLYWDNKPRFVRHVCDGLSLACEWLSAGNTVAGPLTTIHSIEKCSLSG